MRNESLQRPAQAAGNGTHNGDPTEIRRPAYTGPGTLAGRYLRRFWQPVLVAAELQAGWSIPIRILGQNFTLFRGESGTPHLVGYRCAHRGLQLSTGIVQGDAIRCAYHAWTYDGNGQCIEQPAEPRPFCAEIRIPSYPVREYLGLLFAFFGEGEPPPMVRYPHMEGNGLTVAWGRKFDYNYFQHLENAVDETHLSFLHAVSPYAGLNFDVPVVTAAETDFGMIQYGTRAGITRQTYYHMPNATSWAQTPLYPQETAWRELVGFRVPVDDGAHFTFTLNHFNAHGDDVPALQAGLGADAAELQGLRPFGEIADDVLAGRMRWRDVEPRGNGSDMTKIQDQVAQFGQGVIADRSDEHLGNADSAIVLLRHIWDRELRALENGQPLKAWSPTLPVPVAGV